jgi:hypothetical protein
MRSSMMIVLAVAALGQGQALAQIPPGITKPAAAPPPAAPEQLRRAEMFFCEGSHEAHGTSARNHFRQAGDCYSSMIWEGCHHPDVFVNCGNAYLLADELPQAILAYRSGLRRYPLDRQLWENLEMARDQVAYPGGGGRHRPPGDDWPPFLPRATPNTVLFLALGLHVLAWVAATAWLMTRLRKIGITRVVLFATALLMGAWWVYLQVCMVEDKRQALVVVTVNGATLRRGNGSLYPRHPDLPQVNRGMEARLLNSREDWVQVQFPGGEIGWLPREVVGIEQPRAHLGIESSTHSGFLMEGTTNR